MLPVTRKMNMEYDDNGAVDDASQSYTLPDRP